LEDAARLKGKRVAVGPTVGFSGYALDVHLARAGIAPDDVTRVHLDFKQNTAALLGGGVDAMVIVDDFDRDPASFGADIVATPGLGHLQRDFQYSYIYFGQSMSEAGPEYGARFLQAYLRGTREFARGRTPRFMEEFARANGLDVERTVTACRNTFTTDGAIDLNSLQSFAGWAAQRKHVSRLVDVAEMIDDRFIRRANANG